VTECRYRNEINNDGGVLLVCIPHGQPHPCPHGSAAPAPAARRPRVHILRQAPPWRALAPGAVLYTECGRPGGAVTALTRQETADRIRQEGRAAVEETVCGTCRDRTDATAPWDTEPGQVLTRDLASAAAGQAIIELRALAALAQAHPAQFAELVTGIRDTADLHRQRQRRDRLRREGGRAR
jgi:hypothetical protein